MTLTNLIDLIAEVAAKRATQEGVTCPPVVPQS
ncbi:hypothetical protein SAMN06273572_1166 [Monaibacterium marinum]|uniref:Uncharacterized protein n=1 Tax=Pontivivens marinum TaxID=1690039 RepID=A0A2C9CWK9_9RHOB|nr:hypothetical protein SAMN06273572_1166 [Monaibacterium marinum]